MPEMSTGDSILAAAMELFSERGYAAVTTKEIAAKAHVNETTLFRHFETKHALYLKLFSKYVVEPSFEDVFHKQIVWDLSKDLLNISSYFQDILIKNSKLLQINIKDGGQILGVTEQDDFLIRATRQAKEELIAYLSVMKKKIALAEKPEVLATNFLLLNAGIIMSTIYSGFDLKENYETYRVKMVNTFVRGVLSENIPVPVRDIK